MIRFNCAARDRRVCPERPVSGLDPSTGVRRVLRCSAPYANHACSNDSFTTGGLAPQFQHQPCIEVRVPRADFRSRGTAFPRHALRCHEVPVRQRRHGWSGTAIHHRFRQVGAGARRVGKADPGATCPATVTRLEGQFTGHGDHALAAKAGVALRYSASRSCGDGPVLVSVKR